MVQQLRAPSQSKDNKQQGRDPKVTVLVGAVLLAGALGLLQFGPAWFSYFDEFNQRRDRVIVDLKSDIGTLESELTSSKQQIEELIENLALLESELSAAHRDLEDYKLLETDASGTGERLLALDQELAALRDAQLLKDIELKEANRNWIGWQQIAKEKEKEISELKAFITGPENSKFDYSETLTFRINSTNTYKRANTEFTLTRASNSGVTFLYNSIPYTLDLGKRSTINVGEDACEVFLVSIGSYYGTADLRLSC